MNYSKDWKDGWMAYFIDSNAVNEYHRLADALPDDSNEEALLNIWNKCLEDAQFLEDQWNALSEDQKREHPRSPFWKSNNGQPRRISRGQKAKFIEAVNLTRV